MKPEALVNQFASQTFARYSPSAPLVPVNLLEVAGEEPALSDLLLHLAGVSPSQLLRDSLESLPARLRQDASATLESLVSMCAGAVALQGFAQRRAQAELLNDGGKRAVPK